ncbi:diguanylate cyclase [Paraglaciecola sp.]|uniref:diguanylate cyclase n=1 Tax=Paraglaciecola sp. TaxID=1920173 RepID=UPI0030F382A5
MPSILEQKLNEFRDVFSQELNATLSDLLDLWKNTKASGEMADLKTFRFEIHSLKGSSGTLNFSNLSDALNKIENHLAANETHLSEITSISSQVDLLMVELMRCKELSPTPLLEIFVPVQQSRSLAVQKLTPSTNDISLKSHRDISIAIVDNDDAAGMLLSRLLTTFGFVCSHFSSINELNKALSKQSFSIAILDLSEPVCASSEMFSFATSLQRQKIDVFIISSFDTFEARLLAIRAKVCDYLLKPVNITNLVTKVRKNFKVDLVRPYRILLLDDQLEVGNFYKTLLETQGIEVIALTQAEQIMAALESFPPDIFLLDMHMPDVSGLEVAKLIRQQSKYDYVPIIFLTADNDINTKLLALECGADDVIPKQTAPDLILQQLDSRIQRSQQVRYLASRDSLTGVLNHGQIMDAAAHALRLAARHIKPVVLVMIDLDYFKHVNDSYGHMGGDKVLVSLGQLLLQSVRETDFVGRYGGEEFMIVFSDADCEVIENKMESILAAFRHIDFNVNEQVFNCNFSAGLASSENYDKLSELIAAADAALYQAKAAGRNQIFCDN